MVRSTIELWDTGFLVPPHVRGDKEFDGNGPRIQISTRLYISERNKIRARIWMRFTETKADWTTAQGNFDVDVYDGTRDNITKINAIVSPGVSSYMRYDQESGHERFSRPEDAGPVLKYEIVGDTRGQEAGSRTGAALHFRDIVIECEKSEPQSEEEDVFPDPVEYIPPHTRGDREFDGNGPRIQCTVQAYLRNGNEIWARVQMRARETKSDWTTAEGTETFRIYTHDKPIKEILSDDSSEVYYEDHDHSEDVLSMGGGELVKQFVFVGDTRGYEAGTRTGVVVDFNPIRIRV